MRIDEVELRVIRVPFRSAFTTSFGSQTEKHTVIVTVRSDGVEGYGEGVMETLPEYREETLAGALYLLREALVPALLADGCEHPGQLADAWARFRGNPMCKTSLELAVWDCFARQQGVPLRDLIGGTATEIPVGASLGMNPLDVTLAVGRPSRRRGLQADQAQGRAGLGPRAARPGARRPARHRADRRRQLGVHARRHRHPAALRRLRAEVHRAAAALGRPRRPRRARATRSAPHSASTRR